LAEYIREKTKMSMGKNPRYPVTSQWLRRAPKSQVTPGSTSGGLVKKAHDDEQRAEQIPLACRVRLHTAPVSINKNREDAEKALGGKLRRNRG